MVWQTYGLRIHPARINPCLADCALAFAGSDDRIFIFVQGSGSGRGIRSWNLWYECYIVHLFSQITSVIEWESIKRGRISRPDRLLEGSCQKKSRSCCFKQAALWHPVMKRKGIFWLISYIFGMYLFFYFWHFLAKFIHFCLEPVTFISYLSNCIS